MSKPDKPGELRDVTVEAISLVSKAANGEKFKIFKSAEAEDKKAPETVKKDERGLFSILKEFFTGTEMPIEKGDVAALVDSQDKGRKIKQAVDALFVVLGIDRWNENDTQIESDTAKIISAVDDFRNVAIKVLLGKSDIEKSGRKISSPRLSKLKSVQAMLNEVLSELEENEDTSKEAEELTKEEVQKAVADNVEEAVNKALAPVIERIEKIENARGFSNRVPEDSAIEKSANDFWGGIF
jgi:hypothetical protein